MAASNTLKTPSGAPDPGAATGDWLFKNAELVLGPVPAPQIIEKLYTGELTGQSEVALAGSHQFRRVAELDAFRFHLARAEAKLRVDAAAREEQARARRNRNIRFALVAALGVVLIGASVFAARYLAVHNPWKGEVDEFAGISVEAPVIGVAKYRPDEELLEYPGELGGPKPSGSTAAAIAAKKAPVAAKTPTKSKAVASSKSAAKKTAPRSGSGKMSDVADDPDGMQMATFDQEGINAVVRAKQKTLFPCLLAEAKRRPGFTAKIPIEFVIGNEGKVAKLWIDHPDLKKGLMHECMLRELQKWKFKPYEGERATVGLSFKIG